jgi:ketosteroid isomerase-like protein
MQANTAKQVHELFVERFNAQDADAIIELYETNAVILPPDAPEAVSGHVAIRQVLDGFLALNGKMENTIVRVIEQQGIAILYSRWTVSGTGPDGIPVTVGGTTSDVVRRQSDGSWLFAIDNPLGGAA